MASGRALRWFSPRSGFVAVTALTGLCLAATVLFALPTTMSSFVLAWVALTAILAGTSVYAGGTGSTRRRDRILPVVDPAPGRSLRNRKAQVAASISTPRVREKHTCRVAGRSARLSFRAKPSAAPD